jgi:hypothetical protein
MGLSQCGIDAARPSNFVKITPSNFVALLTKETS